MSSHQLRSNHYSLWCPKHGANIQQRQVCENNHELESVVEPSNIPAELQNSNSRTVMPPSPPNGGLYGGPQSTKPWASIPVTPTTTNLIHYNLRSANPPKKAIEMYPSGNRPGNDHTAMLGVYYLNNPNTSGYFNKYSHLVTE